MKPSKINGKINIEFKTNKEDSLNTSVNKKAQRDYEKKCKELGIKFKPLANTPEVYHTYEDE